jgi:hypothetical protein
MFIQLVPRDPQRMSINYDCDIKPGDYDWGSQGVPYEVWSKWREWYWQDDHVRRWQWLMQVARAGTDDDWDEAAFKELERPQW